MMLDTARREVARQYRRSLIEHIVSVTAWCIRQLLDPAYNGLELYSDPAS